MKIEKMIKKMPLLLVVMALVGLLIPATALAQRGPGPHGPQGGEQMQMQGPFAPRHLMRMADELELREDQREALRTLLQENRAELQPMREQLREEGQKLQELMQQEGSSRAQVLRQLDLVLELEGDLKRQRAEMMLDVRELLDGEQRQKVRELIEERRGEGIRGQHRRGQGEEGRQERRQRRQQ